MKTIIDKLCRSRNLSGFILSVCQRQWVILYILFTFFLNYCEAQTAQAVSVNGKEAPRLSGMYSSKNSEASALNPLSIPLAIGREGAILEKEKGSTNFLPSDFPINNQDYKEEIEKRTATSRTFKDAQGGIVIQYSSKNINYLDNENKFQPINTSLSFFPSTSEPDKKPGYWVASQQHFPAYLYKDGSTALSTDEKNKITYNKNCKIDNLEIDISDYTVGEEGMLINNAIPNIDKKIFFHENRIETDYIIREPIHIEKQGLIISEEIVLPEGFYIRKAPSLHHLSEAGRELKKETGYVIYSPSGTEQARFQAPFFYDAVNAVEYGNYNLIQEGDKIILQIIVPEKWLNDVNRAYPITIDPVVTGPVSNYPPVYMNSCAFPNFQKDSILITLPANITVTAFIIEDSYFADLFATPTPTLPDGQMSLSTVCGDVTFSCNDPGSSPLPGTCYLVPNQDLKSYLSCCFSPSCVDQTFYLTHGLARTDLGPGCNQDYIYYSPISLLPPYPNTTFAAYIIGKTVETAQVEWSVSPTTVCSDNCTVFLEVSTNFGVPPYTITHPWATGSIEYGLADGTCNSTGTETIELTIPNCPYTCGTDSTLSIPPPVIIDVCGNSVTGLSPKSITVNPVPIATAGPVSACSGSPFDIPVSSCVPGSTFAWTGSNGSSGTGSINDMVNNTGLDLITINYSVTPTANGCSGPPINVFAEIDTLPVINAGLNDTIQQGVSTQLNATGGLTYVWLPSSGLSCTNCPDPTAAPVISTAYSVTGTNEYGCTNSDTVTVVVIQGDEVLYIPNSFSPGDNNNLNDLYFMYGVSIKVIDIQIYDRWGELIFRTNDIKQGWDGKYKRIMVEDGVYVYSVSCEFLSGTETFRKGIITVVR